MDLFTFNVAHRVWICTACQTGVAPRHIQGHLESRRHRYHPTARTAALRAAAAEAAWKRGPWDPVTEPFRPPPPERPPIPGLPVYDGYACPHEHCDTYAARAIDSLQSHRRRLHKVSTGRVGGRRSSEAPMRTQFRPVSCQRFFTAGPSSSYFVVTPAAQAQRARQALEMSEADFVQAQVDAAILRSDDIAAAEDAIAPTAKDVTETSPWLELTRWPEYVRGRAFREVAALAALPDPATEPILIAFELSVGRLIDAAFTSISTHRINEFDQVRINSFLHRQGVWTRPIQIRLRPATYRRYRQVWVRLIAFVYRTSRPGQSISLRHQLTTPQLIALDRMGECARQLHIQPAAPEPSPEPAPAHLTRLSASATLQARLDRACLDLSIALLDHELHGDLFESALVGFMAALGVDAENQTYRDPPSYTGHLSGLVKIAQMLVAQRAVQLADDGQVKYPGDALDEMRERFLVYGVRAPFGWITRLRTYGKRIQNTSTSLGYLVWSDDGESLQYRELALTIGGLRQFVRTQVELAQRDLERLFLLGEDDQRESVIPAVRLDQLSDDPVNNKRGWNFLKDPRNRAVLPTAGGRWLLDRVLRSDALRKEFTEIRECDSRVVWRPPVVAEYLELVDRFLQRLLLLIHITGGQPARGTEIIALRHSNTPEGRHRNIFIEHGLVSTVTSYHKSQSVTNSIKIIHRYLPREVSELIVYYLWLILPFTETADMLARGSDRRIRSAFLWPREAGHWDAARLGVILKQEAHTHLKTKLNVVSWRHAAIGISRMHLKNCGGFKRDYGADDQGADQQAAHGSWAAGTIYARGLQEAPGVIESRRVRFRAVSREWHGFLGFEPPARPWKRGYSEVESEPAEVPRKRAREYMTIELSDEEAA